MREWKIKKFEELSLIELYSIMRSRCKVFVGEQKITSEEEIDGIDDKCVHIFNQNEDGTVGAYCRIVPKGINYEYISIGRVLVLEELRRHGIAKEMMENAIEYIDNNYNEKKIILSAQLYAKRLYESVGFTQESEVYEEAGIPHIKMIRENESIL